MRRHGEYKVPGGKLVVADVEVESGKLARVEISGDFFLEPDSALDDIDAALTGLAVDADEAAWAAAIHAALDGRAEMYGVSPEAIATAVHRALQQGTAS
jgi:lipoate-protein ligase A